MHSVPRRTARRAAGAVRDVVARFEDDTFATEDRLRAAALAAQPLRGLAHKAAACADEVAGKVCFVQVDLDGAPGEVAFTPRGNEGEWAVVERKPPFRKLKAAALSAKKLPGRTDTARGDKHETRGARDGS